MVGGLAQVFVKVWVLVPVDLSSSNDHVFLLPSGLAGVISCHSRPPFGVWLGALCLYGNMGAPKCQPPNSYFFIFLLRPPAGDPVRRSFVVFRACFRAYMEIYIPTLEDNININNIKIGVDFWFRVGKNEIQG